MPIGGVHGFRNESGEPASMLLLFTPGAPREDYFETLADAARREAMGEDDWTASSSGTTPSGWTREPDAEDLAVVRTSYDRVADNYVAMGMGDLTPTPVAACRADRVRRGRPGARDRCWTSAAAPAP